MDVRVTVLLMLVGVVLVLATEKEADQESAATGHEGHGQRTQFHEQGLKGPHSYRFGYDTGDPHNPQTRYEERDAHGVVRGHYSFVDAHGKLQIVHYEAHPKYGFMASGSFGTFPKAAGH